MPFIEWRNGQQILAGTKGHWFNFDLDVENGSIAVIAPYTAQYGTGTPPWTATLTVTTIDASGTVTAAPAPIATYATGYDFQTGATGLTDNLTAVFWTSANGTYPASSAVDLNARALDANNNPTGPTVTVLSDVDRLTQFRVASAAFGGTAVAVTYSTYDPTSHAEQIRYTVLATDGTPVAGLSGVLDSFTSTTYTAFGFGTLVSSTSANPSFVYLRGFDVAGMQDLAYETITATGTFGTLTTIALGYGAGSTNGQLLDWVWGRFDAPAAGNNLVTVALLSDVSASGASERSLDVHLVNTVTGSAIDRVVPLATGSTMVTETALANGGFVVGYTDGGLAYLRDYDNLGDVIGGGSFALPQNPSTFKLATLPDGRLVVAYAINGGTQLAYDVYTLPTGPTAYEIGPGETRSGIGLHVGDSLTVRSGGTALGTTVDPLGNTMIVQSGGATSGTVLNGGGEELFGGATAQGTTANANGVQTVVTGAVVTGTIVNAGGQQSTGGTTRNTIVNKGGYQFILQPATDYNAVLNAGSSQWLTGSAIATTINGGDQLVYASGVATNAVVNGGDQDVTSGGKATGSVVNGGSLYVDSGGWVSGVTIGGAGQMLVAGGGTYDTGGDAGIAAGSAGTPTLTNAGTLSKTRGTGISHIAVNTVDTGTIAVAGGNIRFDGARNSFSGTYIGPGMIDYGAGSTDALGTVSMVSGACTTNFGTVNQSGILTTANGTTLKTVAGAVWNLTGDVGIALATGSTTPLFTNLGTLAKTAGTGTSTFAINVTGSGAVLAQAGTLAFAGLVNSFAGTIGGAGTVSIAGGATTLNSGTILSAAHVTVSGRTTTVAVGAALSATGTFAAGNGAVLALTGGSLTLKNAATFAGATLNGSQRLVVQGGTAIAGLTIGGTAVLENAKTVSQAGGTVTVGDAGSGAATLVNDAGAVYSIIDDSSIVRGAAAGSILLNQGTLQKTGGSGTSTIGLTIVNTATATATVAAKTGTLDLGGSLSGALALTVGAAATLILEKAAAAGSAASYAGAKATLQLNDAQDYHGTIAGLVAGDTLDLRSIGYAGMTSPPRYQANTLSVSDGVHSASLTLLGSYTASSFHTASDGHGGTAVTVV